MNNRSYHPRISERELEVELPIHLEQMERDIREMSLEDREATGQRPERKIVLCMALVKKFSVKADNLKEKQ